MIKLIGILFVCLLVVSLRAQSTFNIVLGSDRIYVDGINHPLIEKSNDTLITFINTIYSNKIGGKCTVNKLDLKGTLISSNNFLDTLNPPIISSVKNYNNNLLLTGSKFIRKDTTESAWICKLDTKLDTVWTNEFKTAYNSPAFYNIKLLKNGNIALCGNDAHVRPSGSLIQCNGILYILDSLGHKIEIIDSTKHPILYGLAEDTFGNIYSCGVVRKNNFNNDVIIIKVSPQGKLLWRKQLPSDDFSDGALNVFILSNGSILLIGDSYNPDFFGEQFCYTLLININPDGFVNWTKRILKIYNGEIRYCVPDASNNYICSGTIITETNKKADGYLIKLSALGDSLWTRIINYSDTRHEQFYNISQASDGGYYLTGYSWIEGINTSKAWVVKVDSFGCLVPGCQQVVSTNDIKNGILKSFSFYPNPVYDVFYFLSRVDDHSNYTIHFLTLQAQEIYKYAFMPAVGKQYILYLDKTIPPGPYLIQIQDEKGRIIQSEKIDKF